MALDFIAGFIGQYLKLFAGLLVTGALLMGAMFIYDKIGSSKSPGAWALIFMVAIALLYIIAPGPRAL